MTSCLVKQAARHPNYFPQRQNTSLDLHLWLLKTYAIPASMYASQIWSTPFLQRGKEMDNPVSSTLSAATSEQKWLLTVLKRIRPVPVVEVGFYRAGETFAPCP
jgi:hypothetical protein